jgi:hypothetical protein
VVGVMSICGHFHFNESCASKKVLERLTELSNRTIIPKAKEQKVK